MNSKPCPRWHVKRKDKNRTKIFRTDCFCFLYYNIVFYIIILFSNFVHVPFLYCKPFSSLVTCVPTPWAANNGCATYPHANLLLSPLPTHEGRDVRACRCAALHCQWPRYAMLSGPRPHPAAHSQYCCCPASVTSRLTNDAATVFFLALLSRPATRRAPGVCHHGMFLVSIPILSASSCLGHLCICRRTARPCAHVFARARHRWGDGRRACRARCPWTGARRAPGTAARCACARRGRCRPRRRRTTPWASSGPPWTRSSAPTRRPPASSASRCPSGSGWTPSSGCTCRPRCCPAASSRHGRRCPTRPRSPAPAAAATATATATAVAIGSSSRWASRAWARRSSSAGRSPFLSLIGAQSRGKIASFCTVPLTYVSVYIQMMLLLVWLFLTTTKRASSYFLNLPCLVWSILNLAASCVCKFVCLWRFLPRDCPLIRAYGAIRFDATSDASVEWEDYGSFYFIVPQVSWSATARLGDAMGCCDLTLNFVKLSEVWTVV